VLLCDGDECPAVWHWQCLGLKARPFGRWRCPVCEYAPYARQMPLWPKEKRGATKKAAKPCAGANLLAEVSDAESDEN
jgi:hypothetical protein